MPENIITFEDWGKVDLRVGGDNRHHPTGMTS